MTALEALREAIGEEGMRTLFPYPSWVNRELGEDILSLARRGELYEQWQTVPIPLKRELHPDVIRLCGIRIAADEDGQLYLLDCVYDDERPDREGWRPAVFLILQSGQGEHVLRVPFRFAYHHPVPVKSAIAWTLEREEDYNPVVQA